VIATDLGGMTEMIDDGRDGLLFQLNSADDLARKLLRLQNESDLLHSLRQGIRPVPKVEEETVRIEQSYQPIL
jgi:glycosyltransferase involved in cell wall biosynthesis